MKQTFRVDDVSANTDLTRLLTIINTTRRFVPRAKFLFAFSPLVHDMTNEHPEDRERAFPRILSALSDHRNFYRVRRAGSVFFDRHCDMEIASHGLVHVDHRLLGREAQELSIVTSCSLLDTKIFVPPFNKWNNDTVSVCDEHKIKLIRFEDGWQHVKYNKYDPNHSLYYLHTHDTSPEWLEKWFTS